MRVECPNYDVDPAIDKGILFQEGVCPSTDPRLLWDYTQGLLNVDGKIAASGNIATSADLEGSMLASLALGTGSFNFTPPAGYGGLVYRGGSIWYYWDNALNAWETLDFASHVQNTVSVLAGTGLVGGGPLTGNVTLSVDPNYGFVDVYHNGVFVGNRPFMNFNDSVSVSWGISSNGNVAITAFGTGGGAWIANVNANNYSILNLNSINGIPVSLFCTNPFNRDVSGNNYSLNQINNLTVNGEFTYKGQPIEDLISGGGLWTLNADGSIYRDSNVRITGGTDPLVVTTTGASNYLYLNTPATTGAWNAIGVEFNGSYFGEIGWGQTSLELWTKNSLILRGIDAGNIAYLPGPVGIGTQTPQFNLDVVGGINDTTCYYIQGRSFACWDGAGGINVGGTRISASILMTSPVYDIGTVIFAQGDGGSGVNLSNISNINGTPPNSINQSPWTGNINGAGYSLSGVANITASGTMQSTGAVIGASGMNSTGPINTNSCFYVSGVQFACGNGAGGINLSSVATINGAPPGTGSGGGVVNGGPFGLGTQRGLNTNYQNTTGKAVFVCVSILFQQPSEVVAFIGGSSPANTVVARVNTGASTEGTWILSFWVLPGQWYQAFESVGVGLASAEAWSEWW